MRRLKSESESDGARGYIKLPGDKHTQLAGYIFSEVIWNPN